MFTLKIKMGNAAMQTGLDVASALREIADKLEEHPDPTNESGRIRDYNGNTVGEWKCK